MKALAAFLGGVLVVGLASAPTLRGEARVRAGQESARHAAAMAEVDGQVRDAARRLAEARAGLEAAERERREALAEAEKARAEGETRLARAREGLTALRRDRDESMEADLLAERDCAALEARLRDCAKRSAEFDADYVRIQVERERQRRSLAALKDLVEAREREKR